MTKPKERLRYSGEMYIEQWCDGNGNLGPCSCGDGPQGKGHWRLARTVKLDDVLEAARKQWDEETPAQWQDCAECAECAEKAKRAEKERDEARAEVERLQKRLGDRAEVDSGKLAAAFTEGTLAAGDALRSKLREVAERQREACAAYLWAEYPSIVHAERIRATPLVTEDP
jgi:hypothetical protein